MIRRTRSFALATTVALAIFSAACSSSPSTPAGSSTSAAGDPSTDKLAEILVRGTLLLPVDPANPPASFKVKGAERPKAARCAATELTAPEVDGYDVAVSETVAAGLGVEPCFVTPTWTQLIAGNWSDRWDISFSSIGITSDRMENLYFTQPYYATPERFYVPAESATAELEDLDGARIGVCTGCFADLYLQHSLDVPGVDVTYRVDGAKIVGYNVERDGLDDVGTGTLDAFLCQETVGDQAIKEGAALRALDPPAYTAFIAGALDRSSGISAAAFYERVNETLRSLHADGTLADLSTKFFGKDYATEAAVFDIGSTGQTVR